jgi:hypothetical protein
MVSLEPRARCTAAAAVATDFRAEVTRQPATWQPDGEWAYRLALAVESLVERIEAEPAYAADQLAEVRAVLDTALGDEHRDRQRALEEIDAIVNGGDGR